MTTAPALLALRFNNQKLGTAKLKTAADVVSWFGAVQAQDYAGARWAVGQRMTKATDADVERAFDAGEILRTHVLRPTWHFVTPADIRWILELSAPRVHGFNAPYYRRNDLDAKTLARSRKVLERALGNGHFLTRTELAARLSRAKIQADSERLAYVMMHAELERVICSGPRRGRQFTYALVDERAPRARSLPHDEALEELTRRYFTSHGPATVRDFSWWSGLTMRDGRRGLEMLGKDVVTHEVDGLRYSSIGSARRRLAAVTGALLLPNYDEFLIAYKDRVLSVPHADASLLGTRGRDTYIYHLLIDARLAGSWRPGTALGSLGVAVAPYQPMNRWPIEARRALRDATTRYQEFVRC